MKFLDYYKERGLENEDDVFGFFMSNLQQSILTWEFFTDWNKIREKVADVEAELRLLNSLLGKEETEEKFIKLLRKYPEIKKALSLLIAVRADKLRETFIVDKDAIGKSVSEWHVELKRDYFKIKKALDQKTENELLKFYRQSGLKEVFERKDIGDLVDYYFGVEVGMDTHARKNRTGTAMEDIVYEYLDDNFEQIIPQATAKRISKIFDMGVGLDGIKTNKAFDFAVLKNDQLFLIETNYYSGGGSKLKSTAGEYKDYQKFLEKEGIGFIWVTDGLGWSTTKKSLRETFDQNDYIFNLKMLSEGVLKEVII